LNAAKLKSIMVLHGDTASALAQELGVSSQTFSSKINQKGSEFTASEIYKIKHKYKLSACEIEAIFFATEVS